MWNSPAMQLLVFFCSAKCSSWVNRLTFLDAIHTFDSNPWGESTFLSLRILNADPNCDSKTERQGRKGTEKELAPFRSCHKHYR